MCQRGCHDGTEMDPRSSNINENHKPVDNQQDTGYKIALYFDLIRRVILHESCIILHKDRWLLHTLSITTG